jgi:hypothetical protein
MADERWEEAMLARPPARADDLFVIVRVLQVVALPVLAGHGLSGLVFGWFWWSAIETGNTGDVDMASLGWYLGGCVQALLFALCLSFFIIWRGQGGHRLEIRVLVGCWALGVAAYAVATVKHSQWYDSLGIVDY